MAGLVLSEKLDVLQLTFYTAPVSCAMLFPFYLLREVCHLLEISVSSVITGNVKFYMSEKGPCCIRLAHIMFYCDMARPVLEAALLSRSPLPLKMGRRSGEQIMALCMTSGVLFGGRNSETLGCRLSQVLHAIGDAQKRVLTTRAKLISDTLSLPAASAVHCVLEDQSTERGYDHHPQQLCCSGLQHHPQFPTPTDICSHSDSLGGGQDRGTTPAFSNYSSRWALQSE